MLCPAQVSVAARVWENKSLFDLALGSRQHLFVQAPNLGTLAVEICARKCSATILLWIFPVAVFGTESVMKTFFGTLKAARFFLQCLWISSSSILDPSLGIIAQLI